MKKIIKFEKEDCNPCLMVSQYLASKNISFETINPFDNPEMAMKYKIRTVPTTILTEDGNELVRTIGYCPEELNNIIGAL